jgi:ferrochelatase
MLQLPEGHPPVQAPKVGVLLINLGTPDGTGYFAVRRYLSEFLSDRRVIELSPLIWQPILQGPILTFRPKKSGRLYEKIWNRERNESPLRTVTRSQAEALAGRLLPSGVIVDWAMRYGNPSIDERLRALVSRGCRRILLVSLYAQYSAATTATAYDEAFRVLARMRWQPAVRTAPPWHDEARYIEALARSVREHLSTLPFEPEVCLASFHGLPEANLKAGDPYSCFCAKTTRLLREALGWPEDRLRLTFQSRFGPAEWLKPYTEQTARDLLVAGVKRLLVVTPGFSVDCLETLEEIGIGLKEVWEEGGGTHFSRVPCLNDGPAAIDLYEFLIRRELMGWVASPGL